MQERGQAHSLLPTMLPLRVVLTGGPCSGKTTALPRLAAALRDRLGWHAVTVPEAATLFMRGGHAYPGSDASPPLLLSFERAVFKLMCALEDVTLTHAPVAAAGRHAAVLCDRGAMDLKAYMPRDTWEALLRAEGLTEDSLLARYDVVLHLDTVAIGAAEHYVARGGAGCTNDERREGLNEAIVLDAAVADAWHRHADVVRVRNESAAGFDVKLGCATEALLERAKRHGGGGAEAAVAGHL